MEMTETERTGFPPAREWRVLGLRCIGTVRVFLTGWVLKMLRSVGLARGCIERVAGRASARRIKVFGE
ncbi:hypothetical protein DD230_04985 [Neisseria gonorrhoeae]